MRDPTRLHPIAQLAQLPQVFAIKRLRRPDRKRYAVHHYRVVPGDCVQEVEGAPGRLQVVLADDLEPIDGGTLLEDVRIVDGSEAETDAQIRQAKTIHELAPGGRLPRPCRASGRAWQHRPILIPIYSRRGPYTRSSLGTCS